jgi:PAS domain S-box-containing protein
LKANLQKRWILIGAISLIIGILDYFTGYEFSFFVFYFLPVSLAAWFIGKSGAIFFAGFCSSVWAGAFIFTGHFVITEFLSIWNVSIRLVAFLAIGLSVSAIQNALRIEKETARKLRESIIERDKTEAALRASNERFRLAAKAAHIGTYSRNLQSGEDDWSPEFLAIHGFAPHDTLPLSDGIPSAVHPEDRQKVLDELRACIDRTRPPEFSTRHRIVLPSGETRWVMLRGLVEFDLHGRPFQKHGIVIDITEREREQQARQESEERFRIMADGLPLAVWVHDADGRQQFVNRTFLDFFGVTAKEMKDDRWQQLLHPDDKEAHTAEFLACVRERRPFHAEVRVRRRDGGWASIESWGQPRSSASGEYLGYVGASVDITERKRIEAAIRKTEASYRMLFDTMDEAFAIMEMIEDSDGRFDFLFIEANPAFERQTGLRDVAGKTMRQLMPGIEPRWMERYAKVVRTGERIRFEDYAAELKRCRAEQSSAHLAR